MDRALSPSDESERRMRCGARGEEGEMGAEVTACEEVGNESSALTENPSTPHISFTNCRALQRYLSRPVIAPSQGEPQVTTLPATLPLLD